VELIKRVSRYEKILADSAGIFRIKNQNFASNTYICTTSEVGKCILIDPGLDRDAIKSKLYEFNLHPEAIFCTHGHFDHLGSASYFQKEYDCPLYLHESDIKTSQSSNFLLKIFKINIFINIPKPNILVNGDISFTIGKDRISYFHTPGHTPGSSIIEFNNSIFTGDTIYFNSIGLVKFPGEDKKLLKESILKVWDLFPDTHRILPGHGRFGLFGDMKQNNIDLRRFLGLKNP